MLYDRIQGFNTSKRLPIVFCLDVSPSMGWKDGNNSSSAELLNAAVNNFIAELKKDPKACAAAEVAFVTFSTNIVSDTEFESVSSISAQDFSPVSQGGTFISKAVLRSIDKIENRRRELENSEIGYYAPFLVLVTDGDPDEIDISESNTYNKALSAVKSHCDSHIGASEIIIPFIIGVGDHVASQTLSRYAEGFTKGYFPIKGNANNLKMQFGKVFQMIGNSTRKSIHLNGTAQQIIKTIQNDANDLLADLAGE